MLPGFTLKTKTRYVRSVAQIRALKNGEARMVTPARGAAMIGPMYFLRGNGAQHGGHAFHLRLSTFQGSSTKQLPEDWDPLFVKGGFT